MEIPSGLLHPIFIVWAVCVLLFGLIAIVGARKSTREQTMTENSPAIAIAASPKPRGKRSVLSFIPWVPARAMRDRNDEGRVSLNSSLSHVS